MIRPVTLAGLVLTLSAFIAWADPPTIAVMSGSGQSAPINTTFGANLVAVVMQNGSPVPGVSVTFTAPSTGASGKFGASLTSTVTTDTNGRATADPFTANAKTGTYNVVAMGPGPSPVQFSLTNIAGPAAAIAPVTGSTPQSAQVNTSFAIVLGAMVTDAGNNPVPGATVTFAAPSSGASGTFTGGNMATTDSTGQASKPFMANGTPGNYSVTASTSGVATPATFSLTNTAPPAPALSINKTHSGTFTQGSTGTWIINVTNSGTAATSGTVAVNDTLQSGYTLASWTGTNWSCSGSSAVTCTYSLAVGAGSPFPTITLTANIPANSPTSVSNQATASGGNAASPATSNVETVTVTQVPAHITATTGTPQSAQTNTAFANPLVATVTDAAGAPIQGVTVTFTVVPNNGAGGSFSGTNPAITGPNGQASITFTANGTAGSYTVTAASGSLTPAAFSLTNTAPTAPAFKVDKSHGTFTQGQTGTWTINVRNNGNASTSGAVTVTDTLPSGYTLISVSATNWNCTGTSTASVSCTDSVDVVTAGSLFPALNLTVNVPANSPVSVSNSATASGGGAASPAASNVDSVTVNQVAATIAATSGTPQSTQTGTTFANVLIATVKDAGGAVMPGASVTFTVVPNNGAGASFAGSATYIATTNSSGQAMSGQITANNTAGSYTVTAASNAATGATFSLTNTAPATPTLSITKSHIGTFTQGQTGTWTINVGNMGTASTAGTLTVTDNLPTGYTLASGTGTGWTCSGANAVSCTNSNVVTAGSSFPALNLIVNVPNNSPTNVQNQATASGGGAASPVTSSLDSVTVNQVAATITATSGSGQSAQTNTAFTNPLIATVKDAAGVVMPGALVTFTVVPNNGAGGSFPSGNTATTGSNGQASVSFTANGTAGTYTVTAASGAATGASFSLTNTSPAVPVFTVTKNHSGSSFTQGQTGTWTINITNSGTGPTSGTVTVTDSLPAGYTLASGTGTNWSCSGTNAISCTNSNVVTATSSFPPLALTVNVPAASPTSVTNSASASGGGASSSASSNTDTVQVTQVPATITITGGSNQSAPVNTAFANSLVVTVKDAGNSPVPNVPVTFTAPASGASGRFANNTNTTTVNTNSTGIATATAFTANSVVGGPYNVVASATGAPSVNFGLTNTPGGATKLTFTTQPPSNTTAGSSFTAVVQVQDSGGNLVTSSNASVTIASTPSGLTGSTTAIASGGIATFNNLTLNTAGSYTLTASATGLTSDVSNQITVAAGTPSQLVFSTPPSNGTAGQALTPPVVVKIQDSFGNVVNSSSQVSVASTPGGITGTTQVNAVSGVATFNNLVFNAANTYTLTASSASPSLTSSASGPFTISAASANKLVFTTQPPANSTAGQPFTAVVKVEDSNGNVVTGSNAQITITSPSSITGTVTATASGGVASFNNLVLNTAGSYTLTASSSGLTNATSNQIVIAPAAASQLVFTSQPSSGTAGQALTPAVVLQIEDQFGNLVSSNVPVSIASTPAGDGGTTQVNAVAGVATFNNLVFNTANNYTVTATSGSLTSPASNPFTISAASANKLVFTTQPAANGTAGQAFSAVVKIEDANGNVVSGSSAQITITSPSSITGTTQVTAAGGVAAFNNLVLNTVGNYTLTATSTGLTNATSTQIAIGPAAASQLVFTTQPSSGTAGQALTPAVVAQVQDAFGNLVSSNATVAIASNPSGVGGTTQVNAIAGVATFNGLQFNAADNYTLTASSGSLTPATSNPFTISAASANKLVFTTQPPANGIAAQAFSTTVKVEDANGNVVTGSSAQITITSTPPTISGTTQVTAVNGVAQFFNLFTNTAGSLTLTATSTGLTNATSTAIVIGPSTPFQVVFATPPNSGTAGQALTPAVVVKIQDEFNNQVNSSAPVTITSTPSGVIGTMQVNAVNGTATFNNLLFNVAGNYTMTASSAGLTAANSPSFTISAGSGNKLVFSVQPPANGTAGQHLNPSLVVQVQDANGNLVTNSTAAVSLGSSPAGVGGTLTVNASGGIATFNDVSFDKTGSYTLTATSTGLSNATATPIAIGPGEPAMLAFTVQPSSGTAGQPLTPAVVVQIQDAHGNLATSTASVTIGSTPSGAGGSVSVNAAGGIATFGNLTFGTAGNYTLNASSPGLASANSSSFTIAPGSGNKLVFTSQPPGNGTAGQALSSPIVIQVQDANGNLATGSNATVNISSTPAGVSGTLSVAASSGTATFSNLLFNTAGTYVLTATSTGLSNAASTSVAIGPGSPAKLTFNVQPSSGTAGQPLTPAVAVAIQDSFGNLVADSTAPVSVSSTPSGVGGTLTVNAVGGVATFGNLVTTTAGNYTLAATSSGLTNANSAAFTISPGTGNRLVFAAQPPSTATAGQALSPVVVRIQDANGNLVTSSTNAVSIGSTPSGVTGTLTVNAAGGVATFNNLVFTNGETYTLTAAAIGLSSAVSNSIAVTSSLRIVTDSLSGATQATAYSQQLTATGGTPPYVWSMASGALATGLSLGNNGLITGNPTVAGNFGFTAHVRDNAGLTADKTYTLVVATSLSIASCPASTGIVGQPYSSNAVATGGQPPYLWSSGSLPPGLTLNPLNGAVAGTPTSFGSFAVTFVATDKSGATASQGCGFTIAPPLTVNTLSISDASQSSPYSQTLFASGGKSPYSWSLTAGSLPPGLMLAANGTISGAATTLGRFSFTATVTDATGATVQQPYTMNVLAGLIVGACPVNVSEVGFAYNSALVAQGGAAPYTWSIASGTLPQGLQLNAAAGTIAGTPTQVGQAQLAITATDRLSRAATPRQCSIDVRPALSIATTALSAGSTGASYNDAVTVNGGVSPYVFSTSAGSLPPGVTLDAATGKITGRPISPGSFAFTVQAVDSVGAQVSKNLSIAIAQGLAIPNCPSPVGNVGQPYSGALVAQGGTSPYRWIIGSGLLPAGLALDSPNSVISGTPTQPGASAFVLQVNDAGGSSLTRACEIQINAAPLTVTSASSLPGALVGVAYTQTLGATGGRAPYVWSVSSGTLPDGFSLDPAAGVLSGTSTTAGTFSFTVQVTDQDNNVARQNFTLTVQAGTPPNITITGLPDIVDPATQPTFGIQLDGPYPAQIDGTVTLTFIPDPSVGVDDPTIQFFPNGRTLNFTVPANSTTPKFAQPVVAFQTGTVAGTIRLTVKLTSGGSDITPADAPSRSVRVDRLAPRIVSMTLVHTTNGIELDMIGFSTTREVTQGTFTFSISGGAPISVTVPLSDGGKAWFQSSQSLASGGQFKLVQPFTFQGNVGTVTSVSVTLTNGQGTSAPATANY